MALTNFPEIPFLDNALVNIYKSMGGGWVKEADKLAPQPSIGAANEGEQRP